MNNCGYESMAGGVRDASQSLALQEGDAYVIERRDTSVNAYLVRKLNV